MKVFTFKELITSSKCNELVNAFIKENNYSDHQVIGSNRIDKPNFLKPTRIEVKKIIEAKTNLVLQPRFFAMRKYNKGNVLKRHYDNVNTDLALTIPILQSDDLPNPIFLFEGDTAVAYNLKQGDGLLFESRKILHERPAIKSEFFYQAYFGFNIIVNTL